MLTMLLVAGAIAALFLVPLCPDFGLFTNADSPKWALLTLLAVPALAVVAGRAEEGRQARPPGALIPHASRKTRTCRGRR
jgi:hypothetical protein